MAQGCTYKERIHKNRNNLQRVELYQKLEGGPARIQKGCHFDQGSGIYLGYDGDRTKQSSRYADVLRCKAL